MKKSLWIVLFFATSSFSNTQISTQYSYKDYDNSKTKINGKTIDYNIKHKIDDFNLEINYEDSSTKRKNFITNQSLEKLNVEKLGSKLTYSLNENLRGKISILSIEDNLAVTDNGKVYSVGLLKKIDKNKHIKSDFYFSDYEDFNVNQYDLNFAKRFDYEEYSLVLNTGVKYIKINGNQYGNYSFQDKNFQVLDLSLKANYKNNFLTFKTLVGDRLFSVLNDGIKVQHHAMMQESFYTVKIEKKLKKLDIFASWNYQKGKELPENQDNVKTKTYTLGLNYKF